MANVILVCVDKNVALREPVYVTNAKIQGFLFSPVPVNVLNVQPIITCQAANVENVLVNQKLQLVLPPKRIAKVTVQRQQGKTAKKMQTASQVHAKGQHVAQQMQQKGVALIVKILSCLPPLVRVPNVPQIIT